MRVTLDRTVLGLTFGLLLLYPALTHAQNVFPSSGFVGIGTATPQAHLHIDGPGATIRVQTTSTAQNPGLNFYDASGNLKAGFGFNLATDTMLFGYAANPHFSINSSGWVGIGSTTPRAHLEVDGAGATIRIQTTSTTQNPGLNFYDSLGNLKAGVGFNLATNTMLFGHSANPHISINSSGWVGIGTGAPTSALHVAGNAQVDGNIAAKYQDVAEWVRTPRPLTPGTVVVIDLAGADQVVEGSKPFDPLVAGVVSARPGVLLGEKSDDKIAVAHSGRVKVKVDARYGAVAVGDLLVTSPTTGHAMRATDSGGTTIKPGTLLGKALESLANGQGEILVLLTLQ